MVEPTPITYRMLHEDVSGINPDAPVTCNCNFDQGHEANCDVVAAHELRKRLKI